MPASPSESVFSRGKCLSVWRALPYVLTKSWTVPLKVKKKNVDRRDAERFQETDLAANTSTGLYHCSPWSSGSL